MRRTGTGRHPPGWRQRRAGLLAAGVAITLTLALASCTAEPTDSAESRSRTAIRVASFDFSENRVLAELYASALERQGFAVSRIIGVGPRELVQPALERGLLDVVPEYAGSALRFLTAADGPPAAAAGQSVRDLLRSALDPRGLVPLPFAAAQDRNGVVVSAAFATQHGVGRISDLRGLDATLTFGGPPECPQRPYCLLGLRSRYGLAFKTFIPMPSRAVTAEALTSGEISVGILETTDGRLGRGDLVLLTDDRGLQPPENVVPVVRREILQQYGPRLQAALDAVSAVLTTAALIKLNQEVEIAGRPAAEAAADWVSSNVVRSGARR